MKGMCSAERGRLASQQIWESGLWARGWFLIKKWSIQPPCAWVGPSSLVCTVVLALFCLFLPPWHLLLTLQCQSSPLWAAQFKWMVWWLCLLLQLCVSSNTVTSTRDCPLLALHQPVSSTACLLLGHLLVSGYTCASKWERDGRWAFTTGLQLSWWDA